MKRWGKAAGISLVLAVGVANAQGNKPGNGRPDLDLANAANLSSAEKSSRASSMVANAEQARNGVRRALASARAEKDVVKVFCLNDKLNQIDVAFGTATTRKGKLDAALEKKLDSEANDAFAVLVAISKRIDQLSAEGGKCVGQESAITRETLVKMTTGPLPPVANEGNAFPIIKPISNVPGGPNDPTLPPNLASRSDATKKP